MSDKTFLASDPNTANIITLLGGKSFDGVTFSLDQLNQLRRIYGFHEEEEEMELMRAGSERNLRRRVSKDGQRAIAFISRFVETGADPVKLIAQLCIDAGYDITGVSEWAFDEENPED